MIHSGGKTTLHARDAAISSNCPTGWVRKTQDDFSDQENIDWCASIKTKHAKGAVQQYALWYDWDGDLRRAETLWDNGVISVLKVDEAENWHWREIGPNLIADPQALEKYRC